MWHPITFTTKSQKQVKILSPVSEESQVEEQTPGYGVGDSLQSQCLWSLAKHPCPVSTWFKPWITNSGTSFSMTLSFYSYKMMNNSMYPWLVDMFLICSLISICSFPQQQEWPRALWSRFPFSLCFTLLTLKLISYFQQYHLPSFLNWSRLTFWRIWLIFIPLFLFFTSYGKAACSKIWHQFACPSIH